MSELREIEMIAEFSLEGDIRPVRFRIHECDEPVVVKIDKLLGIRKIKPRGSTYPVKTVYKCKCIFRDICRDMDLIYETDTYKWYLKS
ncbi:hypothetical protein [Clostridium sp. LP20]|uniref:hypothetical protein n=1 Tax=Clostridium sp. LP20 TaxID=3418665 RepID=UPI003EE4B7AC